MAFSPPKGVRPPQLEGKRTGRPKGSKNVAKIWHAVLWAYKHCEDDEVRAPSKEALIWWYCASYDPDFFEDWLDAYGKI